MSAHAESIFAALGSMSILGCLMDWSDHEGKIPEGVISSVVFAQNWPAGVRPPNKFLMEDTEIKGLAGLALYYTLAFGGGANGIDGVMNRNRIDRPVYAGSGSYIDKAGPLNLTGSGNTDRISGANIDALLRT